MMFRIFFGNSVSVFININSRKLSMNISSKLKDQSDFPEQYVVLDSTTPIGLVHVGIGVGAIERKNLFLTEVGRAAFERLNHFGQSKVSKLHLVEVMSCFKGKKVVPKAFISAKPGDSIFFVCKDNNVYDSVFAMLGIAG